MITQDTIDYWDYWDTEDTLADPEYDVDLTYLQTPLELVQDFRQKMGQEKDAKRSRTLVEEEYAELKEAKTPVTELKELADLVYVLYGYADAMGWDLDEALVRVHKNNLERCVWPGGSVKRREDGKILKNPHAKKIDLSDLV